MKNHLLTLLLIFCAWPTAGTAQAASLGAVVAWGLNYYGYGQTNVPVAAQSGVIAIAAGDSHTVALKYDGSVVAWGDNYYGQTTVPVAAQSGVIAIAAGSAHTVALTTNGGVVAWGAGTNDTGSFRNDGQSLVPVAAQSGVTAIAAGWSHTVALKNDGSVVAWGENYAGQVTGTRTFDPPYSATASPVTLGGQVLGGVTAIAAGAFHTVALKTDGSVIAWGNNNSDQTTVPAMAQSGVTAIAAGEDHTVALKYDGSVVAWGHNAGWDDYGQADVPVAAQSRVTAIAAGTFHTVALKNDHTVVAWGADWQSQMTVPAGLSGVTAIAAGIYHTVALIGTVLMMPSLTSGPSGDELILSWPTNALGFTLQSALDLVPPVTWVDITNAPAVIGTQFTVTNTIAGSAQFYRLRKQ